VFCDLQPEGDASYLVWFVRSQIRDGLDQRMGDMLSAVRHRPDEEIVTPLPDEVLEGFRVGAGEAADDATRRVQPMLAAQEEVVSQCAEVAFLPELAEHRQRRREALGRDRHFLTQGLTGLAEHWTTAALEAFSKGEDDQGEHLVDRGDAVQKRLDALEAQLEHAGHLLLTAPEVLGVALVLPTPLEVDVEGEEGPERVVMWRDDEVEEAAMNVVMQYEAEQGRHPRDVHVGNSWDIESDDEQGRVARYIEVKGRGPEGADVVTLTGPEWEAARRLGDQHWLFIVSLGDGLLVMIQNPYDKLAPRELRRWVVKIEDVVPRGEAVRLEKHRG
jgi:hypothetical protein